MTVPLSDPVARLQQIRETRRNHLRVAGSDVDWLLDHLATVDQARQQAGWQPIETAPKNHNDPLLLFNDRLVNQQGSFSRVCLGFWSQSFRGWYSTYKQDELTPPHWMRLPEPPQ